MKIEIQPEENAYIMAGGLRIAVNRDDRERVSVRISHEVEALNHLPASIASVMLSEGPGSLPSIDVRNSHRVEPCALETISERLNTLGGLAHLGTVKEELRDISGALKAYGEQRP